MRSQISRHASRAIWRHSASRIPRPSIPQIRYLAQDSKIQARPPGEPEFESKFPLPDKEKEKELARLQTQVQEEYKAGNYQTETADELLKLTEQHFGRDHPATASAYLNLGLLHKNLGNFDQARKSYETALGIYGRVVGKDHASYASALHNLGNLNRNQIHFDSALRATDRLALIEQAEQYLKEAFMIRKEELGHEHQHTVASRSAWGATIATQILHYHKVSSSNDPKQRQYISLLPEHITTEGWQQAEQHLREALETAIANPRGPQLKKKKGKKQSTANNELASLSAASAAQNLAVVLKAKASTTKPYDQKALQEAHELYQQIVKVRSELLPKGHPDMYATQYSFAELLEAMGDEEAANKIRQDIVDTYDPEESK